MPQALTIPRFLARGLPLFRDIKEEIVYKGVEETGAWIFETHGAAQRTTRMVLGMVRSEETDLWQATRTLLVDLLTEVASKIQGTFQFELLALSMAEDWERFQWREFAAGMTDLARQLTDGEARFARYCSLFGVLRRWGREDTGHIGFRSCVRVLDRSAEDLAAALAVFGKKGETFARAIREHKLHVVFQDLSREPLYDSRNEAQQRRLVKLKGQWENPASPIVEAGILDRSGWHPLFQRSQLELF